MIPRESTSMNFIPKNWTIFGFFRWASLVVGTAIVGFVLVIFADENVRNFLETYGLDKILIRASSAMPDILFHRETWFGFGLFIGAAAMVWLVWAFPHRVGQSNAHESPIKKWGTVFVITAAIVGLGAYLVFGRQPTLTMSDIDIAEVTTPLQKQLKDAKEALVTAHKETEEAKQASLVATDVSSQPTHARLQFNSIDDTPVEIEAVNIHWSTFSYTSKVTKYCPYPQFPGLCSLIPAKGDKSDFDQTFIRIILFFDKPIIYKTVNINVFGAKVGDAIINKSNRIAVIELTPDKGVTSFVLEIICHG